MKRALLLVDHGSREPEAGANLDRVVAQLRERRPGLAVYVAHLELAEPSIAAAVAACARDGVEELVVHPFFLAAGRHAATAPGHFRGCACGSLRPPGRLLVSRS